MAYVHFDRRLCEGKVGRGEADFLRLGHLACKEGEQPEQGPEIDIRSQDNALDLEEVGRVRGVHLVVSEAPRDRKVLARHVRRRGQRACGDGRALATEHQAARPHAVEGVTPTARSRVAAAFMHGRDLGQERLGNWDGVAWVLDEVHVVGLAGRVELRHEEGVHVPELVFDQPAAHLLEPHAHELDFDQIEELPVGMLLAGRDAGRFEGDRVLAKAPLAPAPVLQHLGSQAGSFFPHAFLPDLKRHGLSEFL